jgi:2-polyprenyl-6-methoxyphenol hydroxylase-like FAD-dependent oxidoreductase
MGPLDVGIVGGGTAGAAAAILMTRAGHNVTVLERVANPRPVGAGITLQPTGQAALARLGLLDEVAARGARIDRLTCIRKTGKPMVDLAYAEIDPTLYGIGIHRGALFETLLAEARTAGTTVHCGVHVVSTELDARGRWLVDERGERHGPYHLVIAADGGVCELHAAAPHVKIMPYPWGALWVVAPDVPGFTPEKRIYQVIDRCHTMLGFLPTGLGPRGDTPLVSMFWSIRADRVDTWRAAGLAKWRDSILRLEPRAEPILDTLHDLEPVLFSRYRDVRMWPWHAERIVFIGDSAHATSPQLGQGANLALIDAIILADALANARSVAAALADYTAARHRHLNFYQFATRALTPLFQSDSRLLAFVRDLVFPQNRWIRPFRRRMIRTMIGADRGLVRKPFPIVELRALPPPR